MTRVTIILLKLLSAKLHLSLKRPFCKRPENINGEWRSWRNWQVIALLRLSNTRVLPSSYSCHPVGKLNNILGDRLLLNFCAKFQRTKLKFHLWNYIICDGNVPYLSVVPKWSRKFKMLWMKMSGRGIQRRFRKPQRTKEHIKNSSNRYFVEKLVNLSQFLCSKPFSAWYLHENSPSKDKTFKVHITPCKVIRIPESGKFCLWNPEG